MRDLDSVGRKGRASLPEQWILGFLSGIGYEGGGGGITP